MFCPKLGVASRCHAAIEAYTPTVHFPYNAFDSFFSMSSKPDLIHSSPFLPMNPNTVGLFIQTKEPCSPRDVCLPKSLCSMKTGPARPACLKETLSSPEPQSTTMSEPPSR